jgi:hypothetical protein
LLHQQPLLRHSKVAAHRWQIFSIVQTAPWSLIDSILSYGQLRHTLLQQDPRATRNSLEIAPFPSSNGRNSPPQAPHSCPLTACSVIRQLRQNRSILSGITAHFNFPTAA